MTAVLRLRQPLRRSPKPASRADSHQWGQPGWEEWVASVSRCLGVLRRLQAVRSDATQLLNEPLGHRCRDAAQRLPAGWHRLSLRSRWPPGGGIMLHPGLHCCRRGIKELHCGICVDHSPGRHSDRGDLLDESKQLVAMGIAVGLEQFVILTRATFRYWDGRRSKRNLRP